MSGSPNFPPAIGVEVIRTFRSRSCRKISRSSIGSALLARVTASHLGKSLSPGHCETPQSPVPSSAHAMRSRSMASSAARPFGLRGKKLPSSKPASKTSIVGQRTHLDQGSLILLIRCDETAALARYLERVGDSLRRLLSLFQNLLRARHTAAGRLERTRSRRGDHSETGLVQSIG